MATQLSGAGVITSISAYDRKAQGYDELELRLGEAVELADKFRAHAADMDSRNSVLSQRLEQAEQQYIKAHRASNKYEAEMAKTLASLRNKCGTLRVLASELELRVLLWRCWSVFGFAFGVVTGWYLL